MLKFAKNNNVLNEGKIYLQFTIVCKLKFFSKTQAIELEK